MKTNSYFTIEVKNVGGWAQGTWDLLYTVYSPEHANQKALIMQETFGKRNVRVTQVTTKRIPIKA